MPHNIIIGKMGKSLKGGFSVSIPVLFENSSCMVLNKPSGLSVQGGEGVRISLDSILSENYSPRPLLVHRLDKDTSGIILVAKTKEAARGFSTLFAGSRLILKQYLGLCSGIPKPEQGIIRFGLDAAPRCRARGNGRSKIKKKSETSYRCLSSGNAAWGSFSLLELELGTGRMHQIRRHLAQTGCPILGDDKYGDFPLNKKLKAAIGLKHLLLHASRLIVPPSPGLVPDGLDIAAEKPDYFLRVIEPLTITPHFP